MFFPNVIVFATNARCRLFKKCRHLLYTSQAHASIDANSQERVDNVGGILAGRFKLFEEFENSVMRARQVTAHAFGSSPPLRYFLLPE
jgi:hypothetical protein